jgi:lysophospholipid acyltransferase (LPLAT)-like uncharacterized protein
LLKTFLRSFASVVVPIVGAFLIRLVYITSKKNFSAESLPDEPIIYACWHGDLMFFAHSYLRYKNPPHVKAVISSHFDGTLIAGTLQKFGLEIIAGSSNRNAARVLIQGIKALKEGYDIGITPDGPRGPRHEVADGIIAMAEKTAAKVILVEIRPRKYWQLSSWDKFVIPKPFGEINFYYSEPLNIKGMETEQARKLIKEGLLKHEH